MNVTKECQDLSVEKSNISSDINEIKKAIDSKDEATMKAVHQYIDGKYVTYFPELGRSMYGFNEKSGFNYEWIGKEGLTHNLIEMEAKLEGLVCDVPKLIGRKLSTQNINVSVPVDNTLIVNLSFEQAIQKIEDMPGLTEDDTQEIKGKIQDLEEISKEKISKKKKWDKVKPILKFAADKGADVAIAIMSLIMQMKLGN